jgi:hypothetical protein
LKKNILKNKKPIIASLLVLFFIILVRWIAHTRLQSFWDLFLIILLTQVGYRYVNARLLIIVLITQMSMWSYFTHRWHTSYIDPEEHAIIKSITKSIPKNVNMVTLTWAYMSMMTWYMDNEIYSTYQGIGSHIFNRNEIRDMRYDTAILCKNLQLLPGNTFIYVWSNERFSSTVNNPCLYEIKKWSNNARLLGYAPMLK